MQEEHCTKAIPRKTRFFLFFNPFTFILFFQSCSTQSLNMPHNIFDVFKVQQQEEWGSKQRAHAAQQPTADSVGNAPCAPQRRVGGATRQRAVAAPTERGGADGGGGSRHHTTPTSRLHLTAAP